MTYNTDKLPKKNLLSLQIDVSKFEKASDEEKAQHETMRESTTFFRDGMRKLRKNPLAMISLFVLAALVLTIVIVPMFYPYSYEQMISVNGKRDKTAKNLAPFTYSKNEQKAIDEGQKIFPHIFGTDELCRDYFIRVLYGARVSLAVGLFASLIVLVIGLLYGSISGYFGGKVDMVMMRIVDIIYSLPDTLMVILLSVVLTQVLGTSLQGTALAKVGTNMISLFVVCSWCSACCTGWAWPAWSAARYCPSRTMNTCWPPRPWARSRAASSASTYCPTACPSSSSRWPFRFPRPNSPRASCRSSAWACRRRCPRWAHWPTRPAAACRAIPTRWCSLRSSSA